MTPHEYAVATPKISAAVGLPRAEHFMLFCKDDVGAHWTLIGTDKGYFEMMRDASNEVRASLEIPADKFPLKRVGWPDEWAK